MVGDVADISTASASWDDCRKYRLRYVAEFTKTKLERLTKHSDVKCIYAGRAARGEILSQPARFRDSPVRSRPGHWPPSKLALSPWRAGTEGHYKFSESVQNKFPWNFGPFWDLEEISKLYRNLNYTFRNLAIWNSLNEYWLRTAFSVIGDVRNETCNIINYLTFNLVKPTHIIHYVTPGNVSSYITGYIMTQII